MTTHRAAATRMAALETQVAALHATCLVLSARIDVLNIRLGMPAADRDELGVAHLHQSGSDEASSD